ncbi:MAG: hypothetical protein J6W82_06215 [Bacteroidales bacterium]|nr:hypothetical protein [Bacteroidales bacterium]
MKHVRLITLLLLSVFGCARNPDEPALNKVFKASRVSVKSEMGADGHTVLWNKEDKISIFDGVENNCFTIDESSLNGSSASFTGKVSDDASQFVALYPYSGEAVFSGLSIETVLPAEQNAVAGGFDPACAIAAAVTGNETLVFHNLVSLFKISLGAGQTDINAIHIAGNGSEALAGAFSVELDSSGVPVFIDGGADKEICAKGSFSAGESYYLAVLGNVFLPDGITVTLDHKNGQNSKKVVSSSIELEPGTVYGIDVSDAALVSVFKSDVLSFAKGAKQDFALDGMAEVVLKSAVPAGWTVSASDPEWILIQAPAGTDNIDFSGLLTFAFRTTSGGTFEESVTVRLAGINSVQDFKDFRVKNMNGGDVSPYLVGDKIVLNTDLNIGHADMMEDGTCFIYSLAYPLEGSGKTITINNSTTGDMNALFGYLRANVSNLKLAGNLSASDALCYMAPLAAYCGEYPYVGRTVTISNVESTANVTYTNSKGTSSSRIAGLVAVCTGDNGTVSFTNCKVLGKITAGQSILDTGGFVGRGESGSPGVIVTFTDCEFAGEIVYNQTVIHSNPRVGGFVASGERRTKYTRCTNSGKITANLNNTVFDPDGGGGLGGILGRSSKVASGYNMGWYLNNVTTTCQITINGQPSSATTDYFGVIIGSRQDDPQQYVSVTEGGSLIINNY